MKKSKIIVFTLFSFIFLTGFILNKKMATEERTYTLITRENNFEIRFYPKAIQASTTLNSSVYSESANNGFRILAGYIFGGNKENKKIAMTAPVEMNLEDKQSKMSFTMPAEHKISDLPKPNDSNVNIHEAPEEYTASLTFSGYASDEKINEQKIKLSSILKERKIKTKGTFRFLGYNSPYKFYNRRNEVIVSIEYNSSSKNNNDSSYSR